MCGIAAIFHFHPDLPGVDRDELIRMRDQMRSRGPDGCGDWISPDGRVGLGHRRLSIIDLSELGAQPMHNADGSKVIVFNGEIYNYPELRRELESKGQVFRSTSDTEVLLHLYAAEGISMLSRLQGMYAFAIWDALKKELLIARDPYGIKPLYYSVKEGVFRLASQVKAICAGKLQTSPDAAGRAGFFLWGSVPEPYTFFKEIRALPAGHFAIIGPDGVCQPKPHCQVDEILRQPSPPDVSPALSLSYLRSALEKSVKKHLIADVPVGLFLSSGIDSCTLAGLASRSHPGIQTVTLGFAEYKGTEKDEVPLAEEAARHYGARHRTVWVTRADFKSHYSRLIAAMDQPSTDGVNSYFVSQAAREAGLKVALSGVGGDELFGGYPSFSQIPKAAGRLRLLAGIPLLGKSFRVVSSGICRRFTSPKYAGLIEYGGSYGAVYLLRRGMFMPWELPGLLGADMAREGWETLRPLAELEKLVAGQRNDRCAIAALESSCYMKNQLLRDSDWASMAHSLEVRAPLVDSTLLQALQPALQSIAPFTKRDLGRCLLNTLPPGILNRPKTGFAIPVREWLLDGSEPGGLERGLRGWTRHIYKLFSSN